MGVVTSTDSPTRGRPRAFDEDQVLDSIMELFWERGFECASMNDIVEAAGVNKSSLYNAYGTKDELFHRVLDRYLDFRQAMLNDLTAGDRGIDDLLDMIAVVRTEVTGEFGSRGCMGINSSAELGNRSDWVADYSGRFRDSMRESFRRILTRAADLGEIPSDLVEVYVQTITSMMMSLSLTARGGASSDELDRQIDSTVTLINTWRA